jgi:hypothetical protein
MLWFLLSCVIGVESGEDYSTISFEQTKSAHYIDHKRALVSSVRIDGLDGEGELLGHGSGNYLKIGQHKFILTAAHNLEGASRLAVIDKHFYVDLDPVVIDSDLDLAILVPRKELKDTKAVKYMLLEDMEITGETVVYAGFPGDSSKSLFMGTIASNRTTTFVMQSFALPGSSGSIVFNSKGQVVGIVSALKMGSYAMNPFPQLHENLVYCMRPRGYDRVALRGILERWKKSRSEL